MTKEIRSISMSNLNRKSASLTLAEPVSVFHVDSWLGKVNKKLFKAMYRAIFSSQPGILISSALSTIDILMSFLAIFGLSFYELRNVNQILFYISIIYNAIVFLSQPVFLILVISSYFSSKIYNYKWIPTPFLVYILFTLLGIYANFKLHLLKIPLISESLTSYSVQSAFVARKRMVSKVLSVVFTLLITTITIAGLTTLTFSFDFFGLRSAKTFESSTILSCGTACDILRWYVTVVNCVAILGATSLFSILCYNIGAECEKLSEDVGKCPGTEGVDHYVFRFQSIDRSSRKLNRHFSNFAFLLLILSLVGVIFSLRSSSFEYIKKWEFGGAVLIIHLSACFIATAVFVISAVNLNGKFEQFQYDSNKICDLQQLYHSDQTTTIKLLTLILRFKDAKPPIQLGLLFPLTAQHLVLTLIFLAFSGFIIYSIDHGCLNIF